MKDGQQENHEGYENIFCKGRQTDKLVHDYCRRAVSTTEFLLDAGGLDIISKSITPEPWQ